MDRVEDLALGLRQLVEAHAALVVVGGRDTVVDIRVGAVEVAVVVEYTGHLLERHYLLVAGAYVGHSGDYQILEVVGVIAGTVI